MSTGMTLPQVNVRETRTVHPRVTLGLPRRYPVADTAARLAPRTSAEIAADRDAAVAERTALEASRYDLMLTGTSEDVASLDHRIAFAKVRIDQAEVQHAAAVIAEAKASADHEAEQTRRKALRKQAMKASAEVAKLADEYVVEAQRLVPLLEKIRERTMLIEAANAALPDDAEPVPTGEPRCSWNGKLDQPHSSVASRVKLPALGNDAGYIWGETVPLPGRIVHDSN